MMEEIDAISVTLYGCLYLIISLLLVRMRGILLKKWKEQEGSDIVTTQFYTLVKYQGVPLAGNLVLLLVGLFFPKVAISFYIFLTMASFLSNHREQQDLTERLEYLRQTENKWCKLSEEDQENFKKQMAEIKKCHSQKMKNSLIKEIGRTFSIDEKEMIVWYDLSENKTGKKGGRSDGEDFDCR